MVLLKLIILLSIFNYSITKSSNKSICKIVKGNSIFQKHLDQLNSILKKYERILLNYHKSITGNCNLKNDFKYTEEDFKRVYPDYKFLKDLEEYEKVSDKKEFANMVMNIEGLNERSSDAKAAMKENGTWLQFD